MRLLLSAPQAILPIRPASACLSRISFEDRPKKRAMLDANMMQRSKRSLSDYLSGIAHEWKQEFRSRTFRLKLLMTPAIFIVYSALSQHLCSYVEMRKGIRLEDKLLAYVPVVDFSVLIFLVLYTSMIAVVAAHVDKPRVIIRILEMHILVAIARQICILLVALEPPPDILSLHDVFLENTVYPHQLHMTKDLFFSGHVASIWIYFLCSQKLNLKVYLGFATVLMGYMVLSMRIHYSYDVYGALLITTLIYCAPYWTGWFHVVSRAKKLLAPAV